MCEPSIISLLYFCKSNTIRVKRVGKCVGMKNINSEKGNPACFQAGYFADQVAFSMVVHI